MHGVQGHRDPDLPEGEGYFSNSEIIKPNNKAHNKTLTETINNNKQSIKQ